MHPGVTRVCCPLQHERSGVGLACTSTRASGHADFTALPHVSVDQHSAVDDHGSRVLLYEGSEDEDRDADSSESSEDGETDDDDEDEDDIEKIKSEAVSPRIPEMSNAGDRKKLMVIDHEQTFSRSKRAGELAIGSCGRVHRRRAPSKCRASRPHPKSGRSSRPTLWGRCPQLASRRLLLRKTRKSKN